MRNVSTNTVSHDLPHSPVAAMHGAYPDRSVILTFENSKRISGGAFGVVYQSSLSAFDGSKSMNVELYPSNIIEKKVVAVKKVIQDERYKNRELQILRLLDNQHVIYLKYFFYERERESTYLYLIFDYFPMTLFTFYKECHVKFGMFDTYLLKRIMKDIMSALDYIHGLGITHRDIKPHNLMYNPKTNGTILTDFGSAKHLVRGQKSVSYICSRHYRAPELILGTTLYTSSIDIWSAGCVMGEIIGGRTLFYAADNNSLLSEIIRILGPPTRDDIYEMNPESKLSVFSIKPVTLRELFKGEKWEDAIQFLNFIFIYSPYKRPKAKDLLAHTYLANVS